MDVKLSQFEEGQMPA